MIIYLAASSGACGKELIREEEFKIRKGLSGRMVSFYYFITDRKDRDLFEFHVGRSKRIISKK
ncbi:hypothetical protein LCGC14_1367260 [marine sediment metagenome]|uniref:Uncharacterized protein n=1 Tax=marine sediment metagenome TaxID=412755 RepID=A0A0F9K6S1_9ZZZZ